MAHLLGSRGEIGHQPAVRGDLGALGARAAAQPRLHRPLEPLLADAEAGGDQQRIVRALILLGRGGADIADEVADRRAERVTARKAARRRDAGQLRLAQADRGEALVIEALDHRHRLIAGRLVERLPDPRDILVAEREHLAEFVDRAIGILQPIGDEIDAEAGAVDRDRPAVAIDDPAPARRDHLALDTVCLGELVVSALVDDRHPAHPPGEQPRHAELRGAERERAAGEAGRQRLIGDDPAQPRTCPRAAHRRSRQRSSRAHSRAAGGKSRIASAVCGTIVHSAPAPPLNIAIPHAPSAHDRIAPAASHQSSQ